MAILLKHLKWIVGSAAVLIGLAFVAQAHARPPRILDTHRHIIKSKRGGAIPFRLEQYINKRGQKEVAVYDEVIDNVTVKSEAVVMYGRDTDDDGFYDAWFLLGGGGVAKAVDRQAKHEDGWDAARQLLVDNADIFKQRNLALIWFEWISRLSAGKKTLLELEQTQINLHEVEIRTDRMAQLNPTHELVRANYQWLSEAWAAFNEKAEEAYSGRIKSAMIDTAIATTGYAILKWATPILSRLGIAFSETSAGQFLTRISEKYFEGLFRGAKATLARIKSKIPHPATSVHARANLMLQPVRMTAQNITAKTQHMLDVMEGHDKLSRTLAHLFKHALEVGRGGVTKKGYVAGVTGAQVAVEVYQRRKVLFDLDPIVLPERVRNWKELAHNVGYMTTETFVGSGVALRVASPYATMGICAILSTVDSAFWTLAVKGENDAVRMAVDTGWAITIGNLQTTIGDPLGLAAGKFLAMKYHNEKYRLVGWAIVATSQTLGYFGYNYVTEEKIPAYKDGYERYKAKKPVPVEYLPQSVFPVQFVPIIAPI